MPVSLFRQLDGEAVAADCVQNIPTGIPKRGVKPGPGFENGGAGFTPAVSSGPNRTRPDYQRHGDRGLTFMSITY